MKSHHIREALADKYWIIRNEVYKWHVKKRGKFVRKVPHYKHLGIGTLAGKLYTWSTVLLFWIAISMILFLLGYILYVAVT